ncbi:MAG TPA: transcription antitermination factor NusB [Planctomycetota bacterium]|nr:transcription antitermination factor NusB [Planctomycetota bacterium]
MKNVRALAAQVLVAAEKQFVDEALEAQRGASLSRRDRALLTTLAYGVTRWKRELDWLIDRCAQRVHPEIRQHLRVALFQMRHLDKIPRHAAVNEAVELAKGVSRKSAGFVNAVLRKAADMELPDTVGVRTSHPDWLIERWRRRYKGAQLDGILEANNAILPLTIRPNPLKATGPIEVEGDPAADPRFAEGLYTVQDETSMKVAPLLDPKPGERVLDLCAAPGGKTTQLAELMGGKGVVVAVDLPDRIGLVAESAKRLALPNIECVAGDGATVAFKGFFDAILVDAPCSNTGVLSRRPDVRWRLKEKDIAGAVAIQRALLANAARLLKPYGRLVYSTCSLEPEENTPDPSLWRVQKEDLTLPTDRHSGGYQALLTKAT